MKTEQKIQSISEAFSMQPQPVYVGAKINDMVVSKIELGEVYQSGDPYEFYICLTSDGKKVCEFRKETVNVFYYP